MAKPRIRRTQKQDIPALIALQRRVYPSIPPWSEHKLSVQLTELTDAQAAYIGVPKEGPYKTDQYRY